MVDDSRAGLWQARSAVHTLSAWTFCLNRGADFSRMDNTFSEQISSPVDDPNDVGSRWRRAGGPAASRRPGGPLGGPSPAGGITIEAKAAATNPASTSLARNGSFMLLWAGPVSYTHLTLPTKRIVEVSVVTV